MQWVVAIVLVSAVTIAGGPVNYCGAKMCMYTDVHTLCAYRPGPSLQCLGYIPALLSNEEKFRIVDRLNRRRNDVANGRLRGMPTAGNMLKLHWMEELAREAQLWADQCQVPRTPEKQDVCRDLYTITVGQCVASILGEAPGLRVESMVDVWYMQNLYYKGNVTSYEPPNFNSSYYGDFAQMIWARAYLVGCGRSKFMIPWQGRIRTVERLVCNFAPRGPPAYRPLWSPALPTTVCPPRSRQDEDYPALCDLQRVLDDASDMDDALTLEEHIQINAVMEVENNQSLHYQGGLDELYLTKLAVATMENEDTTPAFYNSLQKRDIAESIGKELGLIENYTELIPTLIPEASVVTNLPTIREYTQPVTLNTRTVKFIGRPKSYNLEDLNKVENHEKVENIHDAQEKDEVSKDDEPYGEYEYQEISEDNLTTTLDSKLLSESTTSYVSESTTDKVEIPVEPDILNLVTITKADITPLSDVALTHNTTLDYCNTTFSSTESANDSMILDEKVDEYLSDPDTVRELQEVLDRMERSVADTTTEVAHAVMVRRELRDSSQYDDAGNSKINNNITSDEVPLEANEKNKSIDKTPMINMVLKYMPYLKQYENTLMSHATGGETSPGNIRNDIILFVSLFCVM